MRVAKGCSTETCVLWPDSIAWSHLNIFYCILMNTRDFLELNDVSRLHESQSEVKLLSFYSREEKNRM